MTFGRILALVPEIFSPDKGSRGNQILVRTTLDIHGDQIPGEKHSLLRGNLPALVQKLDPPG